MRTRLRATIAVAGRSVYGWAPISLSLLVSIAVLAGCGGGSKHTTTTGSTAARGSSTPAITASTLPKFTFPNNVAGQSSPYPHSMLCKDAGKTYPFAKAPLLGSPPAGYLGPVFKAVQGTGIVVAGQFGYSATSTPSMTLLSNAADVASINDGDLAPDPGSVNPWTTGTRVFAKNRSYHLLFIPQPSGQFDMSTLASSLRQIRNVMLEPVGDGNWFFQNRGYYSFNGYNNYGWGGPTHTPFPAIFQVNLTTGQIETCNSEITTGNALTFYPEDASTPQTCVGCPGSPYTKPYPFQSPTYYTTGFGASTMGPNKASPTPAAPADLNPGKLLGGAVSDLRAPGAGDSTAAVTTNQGIVFPSPATAKNAQGQTIADKIIYYYRPSGTVPGMNVAQHSDKCATNAGAALDPDNVNIIRVPVMPTTYNVRSLTPSSVFEQPQERLYTLGVYGRDLVTYRLGYNNNFYLGNQDIRLDSGHGATFFIYPHSATRQEVSQYVKIAQQNGWNILIGNDPLNGPKGTLVSDISLFRIRNAAPGYYGALYPSQDNPSAGAPCYANDPAYGTNYPLQKVPPQFRVTPAKLGPAAMLGVVCPTSSALNQQGVQQCLTSLKQAFQAEGGNYNATPPPGQSSATSTTSTTGP